MATTLLEDIKTQSEWITKAFAVDKLRLDYTIHSFMEIDKFFNLNSKFGRAIDGKRLVQHQGKMLFSIGSYVGETIIRTMPGAGWHIEETDPQGEFTASIKLPDGSIIWPIQKTMKRFENGPEDSIYVYGHHLTANLTNETFDESYWEIDGNDRVTEPWWKIW